MPDRMITRLYIPPYPLNNFIEEYFYHKGYIPPHHFERFLPDGAIYLIIDLSDWPKKLYDNEDFSKYQEFKGGWFSGIRKHYITIGADGGEMIVVRFKPHGAAPFFKIPMEEFRDKVIELDLILGSEFRSLRDHLVNVSLEQKFPVLDTYLTGLLNRENLTLPFIQFAVETLSGMKNVTLQRLVEQTGYSHKHFINLFRTNVGITPKVFNRIMKFQHALVSIESSKSIDWSEISYSCGFYDQAHFINEFRQFSGVNPTQYLVDKGEHLNWVPIQR